MSLLELSKRAIEKIKTTDSIIQIVTHNDADGISAAAILIYALVHLKKSFQVTVVKKINNDLINLLNEREPKLSIFTDIGSSYTDEMKSLKSESIIIDHHDVKEELPNTIQINPEMFDIHDLSGSGTAYIFTQEILKSNILAPIALIGTIGDSSEGSCFIFEDANSIGKKKGLKLFGRFSRPLHMALQYSSSIPNITNESKAIQFLAETGINPKEGDEWRTLEDLTEEEYQKLCDSLIQEQLKNGYDIDELFGDIWTLKNFPRELQDVKEFATLLNACGRMGEGATGIALCLGSKKALDQSKAIMANYRKMIRTSLRWVEENPQNVKQSPQATYILAGDAINENLIGTVVSMCFNDKGGKPIFGFSNAEDEIKVSARGSGMNISKLINEAAESVGGSAGGHHRAAGARLPLGKENDFILKCDELISKTNI